MEQQKRAQELFLSAESAVDPFGVVQPLAILLPQGLREPTEMWMTLRATRERILVRVECIDGAKDVWVRPQ